MPATGGMGMARNMNLKHGLMHLIKYFVHFKGSR